MVESFLYKKKWTKQEKTIFFYNLELLRANGRYKKYELNELIGVKNIYRNDQNRPGRWVIERIKQIFGIGDAELIKEIEDPQKVEQKTPHVISKSQVSFQGTNAKLPHAAMVALFKDKKWAREMNEMLLNLERLNPDKKEAIKIYLEGLIEGVKLKKKTKKARQKSSILSG